MDLSLLIALLSMFAAFTMVGLIFFKKGEHTTGWYLTLMPFVIMASLLGMFFFGQLPTLVTLDSLLYRIFTCVSAVLGASAMLLFGTALGAHQDRIPMWHQQQDKPYQIVHWGVYRYIRHPFYASYYVYMIACAFAAPTYSVWVTAAYCLTALNLTAVREEKELLGVFGKEYAEFMLRTGRFVPRVQKSPTVN